MAASTGDGHLEGHQVGGDGTTSKANTAAVEKWIAMERDDAVDALNRSPLNHVDGAGCGFLSWLEDEPQVAAGRGVSHGSQLPRKGVRREAGHGRVRIVPAGMATPVRSGPPWHVLLIWDLHAVQIGPNGHRGCIGSAEIQVDDQTGFLTLADRLESRL